MQSRVFLSQLLVTGDESGFFLCLSASCLHIRFYYATKIETFLHIQPFLVWYIDGFSIPCRGHLEVEIKSSDLANAWTRLTRYPVGRSVASGIQKVLISSKLPRRVTHTPSPGKSLSIGFSGWRASQKQPYTFTSERHPSSFRYAQSFFTLSLGLSIRKTKPFLSSMFYLPRLRS